MRKTSPRASSLRPALARAGSVTSTRGARGIERALRHAEVLIARLPSRRRTRSVSAKPRPFSGRDSAAAVVGRGRRPGADRQPTGGGAYCAAPDRAGAACSTARPACPSRRAARRRRPARLLPGTHAQRRRRRRRRRATKKFTLATRSRLPRPCLPSSTRKLSRALRWKSLRSVLVARPRRSARAPSPASPHARRSCRASRTCPRRSSSSTRPMSEYSTRPVVRNAVYWAFSVSGML